MKDQPVAVLLSWAALAFAARPRNPATAEKALASLEAAVRAWHAARTTADRGFYLETARFWAAELGFFEIEETTSGGLVAVKTGTGYDRTRYALPPVILDKRFYSKKEV